MILIGLIIVGALAAALLHSASIAQKALAKQQDLEAELMLLEEQYSELAASYREVIGHRPDSHNNEYC